MTTKAVIPRELANQDVDEAIDHYLGEGAEQAALRFVDDLEKAYTHISRQSASGSPRYAHELNLPGLRFWPLTRLPVATIDHSMPFSSSTAPIERRTSV